MREHSKLLKVETTGSKNNSTVNPTEASHRIMVVTKLISLTRHIKENARKIRWTITKGSGFTESRLLP